MSTNVENILFIYDAYILLSVLKSAFLLQCIFFIKIKKIKNKAKNMKQVTVYSTVIKIKRVNNAASFSLKKQNKNM